MNKKQIAALVETMVQSIVTRDGVTEDVARTLIGLAISQNQTALTTVHVPVLKVAETPDEAAA
jgi:hypothetical protein